MHKTEGGLFPHGSALQNEVLLKDQYSSCCCHCCYYYHKILWGYNYSGTSQIKRHSWRLVHQVFFRQLSVKLCQHNIIISVVLFSKNRQLCFVLQSAAKQTHLKMLTPESLSISHSNKAAFCAIKGSKSEKKTVPSSKSSSNSPITWNFNLFFYLLVVNLPAPAKPFTEFVFAFSISPFYSLITSWVSYTYNNLLAVILLNILPLKFRGHRRKQTTMLLHCFGYICIHF